MNDVRRAQEGMCILEAIADICPGSKRPVNFDGLMKASISGNIIVRQMYKHSISSGPCVYEDPLLHPLFLRHRSAYLPRGAVNQRYDPLSASERQLGK